MTTDNYQCEHVVDRLWLFGGGNVNAYASGSNYDTSKFSAVFTGASARIKHTLANDGTVGSATRWWLRNPSDESYVYFIDTSGSTDALRTYFSYGFSPAFVIA